MTNIIRQLIESNPNKVEGLMEILQNSFYDEVDFERPKTNEDAQALAAWLVGLKTRFGEWAQEIGQGAKEFQGVYSGVCASAAMAPIVARDREEFMRVFEIIVTDILLGDHDEAEVDIMDVPEAMYKASVMITRGIRTISIYTCVEEVYHKWSRLEMSVFDELIQGAITNGIPLYATRYNEDKPTDITSRMRDLGLEFGGFGAYENSDDGCVWALSLTMVPTETNIQSVRERMNHRLGKGYTN